MRMKKLQRLRWLAAESATKEPEEWKASPGQNSAA